MNFKKISNVKVLFLILLGITILFRIITIKAKQQLSDEITDYIANSPFNNIRI